LKVYEMVEHPVARALRATCSCPVAFIESPTRACARESHRRESDGAVPDFGGPADYDSARALLAAVLIADNDFAASDLNDRGPGNHGIRAVNADSKVLEPGVTTDRQPRD